MNETEFLVVGGGPTGLGAASRLEERQREWHLLEAENHFGGLASSWIDPRGFTWDHGGHVQFSHYETFDRYMDLALGEDGWLTHQRESWIWLRSHFVPYPFQNNLHRLDPNDRWDCVRGLWETRLRQEQEPEGEGEPPGGRKEPANFDEWVELTFGEGISSIFMRPYNRKVWACPLTDLDHRWIGERVAVPDFARVLRAVCTGRDDVSWGPNSLFRFPRVGGTGAVWEALGARLPPARISLGQEVRHIDSQRQEVTTRDGTTWRYRYLISTMPLNRLVEATAGVVDARAADSLAYASTHVVGLGIEGSPPESVRTKCWMYFPEANSPYYRVTVFSNYSPNNVARPGQQWSLMAETSSSRTKPMDRDALADDTIRALREDALLPGDAQIASLVVRHIPQGYPIPFVGRDGVVDPLLRKLERFNIFSRGRFGAWKYEVSNQDHSFAQGYECVDRQIEGGGPECEPTLFSPALVNRRRNP